MNLADLPDTERFALLQAELMGQFMRPPPRMSVTDWSEAHRVLSAKDSAEPGPYRASRTPYSLEPQDALGIYSDVEEVVLMFGAQTGKTTIGMNWIASLIDMQPGPIMLTQPTLDMAKRFSRQRLTPMLAESPVLARKVSENRSRDDANTMLLKEYAGGFMAITGANSAAGLRSMPIRDIFFDEIDAYPLDVDGEGDPIALAEARQSTFARRKRLKTSTPTAKGFSRVEDAFLEGDQRYYHIECPHCNEHQALEWGADKAWGVKWDKDADGEPLPHTAHYVCRHNGCIIEEHEKARFLLCEELGGTARWIPSNPYANPRRRSYHLSSIYSPLGFLSWSDLVREWHIARQAAKQGDQSRLRAFVNTRLAETWEEASDKIEAHALARRAETYPMGTVPLGGLMLTAGVDVQPDRLEVRIWAWGRGEESWLVGRHVIYGDPNLEESAEGSPWRTLTDIRTTPIPHHWGAPVPIMAMAIDTGGQNTQAVYNYCRQHHRSGVLAIKGLSQRGRAVLGKPSAVDVRWNGRTLPRGLKLWGIGTDTAKHTIYGRLRIDQPGPGYVHLPAELSKTDEFDQLTAERLATRYVKGRPQLDWVLPPGRRNEALDCAVYAYAAACWLGIQGFREPSWARLEEKYSPREPGLFDEPAAAQGVATTTLTKERPPHENRPATNRAYSQPGASAPAGSDWSFERR